MIMYIDISNITKDIFNIILTILIHLADGRRGAIIYTLCLLNITLIITKYIYKNFEEHIITIVYTVYSIKLRGTLSTTDIISKVQIKMEVYMKRYLKILKVSFKELQGALKGEKRERKRGSERRERKGGL